MFYFRPQSRDNLLTLNISLSSLSCNSRPALFTLTPAHLDELFCFFLCQTEGKMDVVGRKQKTIDFSFPAKKTRRLGKELHLVFGVKD